MKGLVTILEQNKLNDYLDNLGVTDETQKIIDSGNIAAADAAMCKVCSDIVEDGLYYSLLDADGEDMSSGMSFEELWFEDEDTTIKNLEEEIKGIILIASQKSDGITAGILFEVDTSVDPYADLDQKEKDKFLSLTSSEETLLEHVCYILETLAVYTLDSLATEPIKAINYYKKICKLFKPKKTIDKSTPDNNNNKKEVIGITGCMDETAKNYSNKFNTKCDGCCTYDVRLAPISYDISFYEVNEFPDGNKFTMNMGKDTYGVCVQERTYNKIGDDGYFYGYQDNNDIPLNNIEKDRLEFKGDVGFYSDSPSDELKSDLRRAITLYMNRAARSYKSDTEEMYGCTLAPLYMNGIIVEIKDSLGVNHGVIKFGEEDPTLRIGSIGYTGWFNYRASNTPSGKELSEIDVKLVNTSKGGYHAIDCEKYNQKKYYTSNSDFDCVKTDDGWITVRNNVSESIIGLGKLIRRK